VVEKLKTGWSPEQIAGRIEIDCAGKRVSHEAIYQFVYRRYFQGEEDLRPYLKRRHRSRQRKGDRSVRRLKRQESRPWIDDRPSVVERRERVGDWEGDTMVSSASLPVLVTLTERKSGLVRIRRTARATAQEVSSAMIKVFWRLPRDLRQTLTLDNGSEHSRWRSIERYSGVKIFFAHPYHSWERGTNENTNGLIRWYLIGDDHPSDRGRAEQSSEKTSGVEDAIRSL
jgi:transposase, IS30 family